MIDKVNTSQFDKNTKYKWDFNIELPEEGLDPIFRIRQLPGRVFITEDVYRAIEENNIKKENKVDGIKLYNGSEYLKLINNEFVCI